MNALLAALIARPRPVLLVLALVLVSGAVSYITIPKESDPDIAIPIVYVLMTHDGISPEDAERLLIRPMEQELRGIEGIKEIRSNASEGEASVTLEFEAGFDVDEALADVREKVDIAKAELPAETDEPTVHEVNIALFPVLVVTLYGDISERVLVHEARSLRDKIEGLPGILEADIAGNREDLLEVIIDPARIENYDQSPAELINFVARNNQLVAAGAMDSGKGRFAVKVPGLFENVGDILALPVQTVGDKVVRFKDVAFARRTFKDPNGFARVNGQPAVALEISKRIGANIIDTIASVRALVEEEANSWPPGIKVSFSQDKSVDVENMLGDLQNNVIAAVILVMIVVVAALGLRTAGLVGVSIPGSFLAGILVISFFGLTINIVVLFSLIMAVGMLVDGTIVVVESADRRMAEGYSRREAYTIAAQRMCWPIVAATATTLAAFMPLLFWPGIVGEFMKYLPITLIATLSASLFMALIFVPTLGGLVGARAPDSTSQTASLAAAEIGDIDSIGGLTGFYIRLLERAVKQPLGVVALSIVILVGVYAAYGRFGNGVEFFPKIEPENALINVRARGDLSVFERDELVRQVEQKILDMPEFETIYARSGAVLRTDAGEDVIGQIQLEFVEWDRRRKASEIFDDIRKRTADLAGIVLELRKQEEGPAEGKPIKIELASRFAELLPSTVEQVRAGLRKIDGFVDVTDSRPVPGIEWQLKVDRAEASRFGTDVSTIGASIQFITNGIKIGGYRPADADDEVDIRVRFPANERSISRLDNLRVPTSQGAVPIGNFVERKPVPRVGTIKRSNARRVLIVEADVEEGVLVDNKVQEIRAWIETADIDPRVAVSFKGEDQDQREAEQFLVQAFGIALFVMAIILVAQFNSFYQAILILSAVVLSTVGVLLGLLLTGEPFGIVMSGVGVIALAGIVVNNNIVLIDTFNTLRARGMDTIEAVLRTGAQRLRPVILTTVTTILGLMPMVLGLNIDLLGRSVERGAPSSQWWTQLATAIAGGLSFATLLTLVLTPCLLVLGARIGRRTALNPTQSHAVSSAPSSA